MNGWNPEPLLSLSQFMGLVIIITMILYIVNFILLEKENDDE